MNEVTLRDIRTGMGLTQAQAASLLGVSLRTYGSYENSSKLRDTLKHDYLIHKLSEIALVDEAHGVLSLEDIRKACADVFSRYKVSYCYIFGSYAKGKATKDSDVDLIVSCQVTGLKFYGMVEELREKLHKKVDVLTSSQLTDNPELIEELLKDGVKIYG